MNCFRAFGMFLEKPVHFTIEKNKSQAKHMPFFLPREKRENATFIMYFFLAKKVEFFPRKGKMHLPQRFTIIKLSMVNSKEHDKKTRNAYLLYATFFFTLPLFFQLIN